MSLDLPDFECLKTLAEEDPQELEFLCHFYSRLLIDNAPKKYQKRLNGLLFQIEVSRRRSKNPLHSCMNISKMMMDSLDGLMGALNNVTEECYSIKNKNVDVNEVETARVIQFK